MQTNQGTFKIATIGGIDIKAHWSWLLILFLFTFQLGTGYFSPLMPGESGITYLLLGLVSSLLLFASVLVHELCHSFTARARGYKVSNITLFIFGGVSNIEEEPKKASDEFWIAVVGPLSSLVLGGVFYVLSLAVTPSVHKAGAYVASICQYLALINVLLAVFNMLPGFPLDGGRVLRSIIWGVNRNYARSTQVAGFVGQLVAYAFIFWGLYETFFNNNFNGLWTAFIGWFLLNAAQQSVRSVGVREVVRGVTVASVMEAPPPVAAPHMTLAQLLTQYILAYNLRAVPVTEGGKLMGIVTLGDIKDVAQDQWGMVTVNDVMTGPEKLKVVRPQDGLDRALELLGEGDFDQLPVVDQAGHLVGMLTRARVLKWMQIREELHAKATGQPPTTPDAAQGTPSTP